MTFSQDQLDAAKAFAYTMIVVDDEPKIAQDEEAVPGVIAKPGRGDATPRAAAAESRIEAKTSHPLDAKGLIDRALELGLVCSVVNPTGGESRISAKIAKAAMRADIISLDWHMNDGDDGELASEIVKSILIDDEQGGGRLRLIAIYTGNRDRAGILGLICKRLNDSADIKSKVSEKDGVLVNSSGLRLVWREKSFGRTNPGDAISELQLPEALLTEFSKLSAGLLANVALATISSIRDATHHILGKFKPELDGPFFNHRAFLKEPSDSNDYAVSIVLSALKAEVDKSKITSQYTSVGAIKRRLAIMDQSPESFKFRFKDRAGTEKEVTLHLDEVVRIVTDGWTALSDVTKRKAISDETASRMSGLPGRADVMKNLATIFFESSDLARRSMLDFSFLTNARSSELSRIHRKLAPKLDLGSVLYSPETGYLLCLQATCDTVRGTGAFFFVPMVEDSTSPDHVVPHGKEGAEPKFVCLSVPDNCYTQSRSLNFGPIDPLLGLVPAVYNQVDDAFYVQDALKVRYRWLANLKYKRALRIAQDVSRDMSRIGFDEFEPFRKQRKD